MIVVDSISEWKALRGDLSSSLGLVPTMGALHEGHLSLVRRARRENEVVVVWIFVNPKQFGEAEDFETYPRDMEADGALLEAEGCDYILAPGVEDVYPPGFQTHVEVEGLTAPLEGIYRPGHFRGVTTVVAKMLCLAQPRHAYFGQKDAQQSLVVRRMAQDLGMLCEIVVCPTIREPDGLAMSSRNVHLNAREREAAAVLFKALRDVEVAVACGERDAEALRGRMRALLEKEPLARIEYASIADPETLEECSVLAAPALASLAVYIGKTRLIDNIPLHPQPADRD